MFNKKLTAEQRVSKGVVAIMNKDRYVALTQLVMVGNRSVSDDIPTACTNGRDEIYGREMTDNLSDPELRFVILHENYHKLYRHGEVWHDLWKANPRLANMACDYVINIKITDDNDDGFATMPTGDYKGLLDDRFRGMDSRQVFDLLKQEEDNKPSRDGNDVTTGGDNTAVGFDDHDWDGYKSLSPSEKRELIQEIEEAIHQGALLAGKTSGGVHRDIAELLKPQVDWRKLLRDFVSETVRGDDYTTLRRPNRRYFAQGYYLPSGESEKVGELIYACDNSGSVGAEENAVICTEVESLCELMQPDLVRVLYWDTEILGEELYRRGEQENMHSKMKPKRGGGTCVECVPKHISDNNLTPQAVIVVTDGCFYRGWGSWNYPVLWIIIDNEKAVPPCGKVIHVTTKELMR